MCSTYQFIIIQSLIILKYVKADLDGASFAYHCRMRFLERAARVIQRVAHNFHHSTYTIAYTYDCRRILKHVLKSCDIFCDVYDSRKRVVGLIYTKQFVS